MLQKTKPRLSRVRTKRVRGRKQREAFLVPHTGN
jgi:hypothetical protein